MIRLENIEKEYKTKDISTQALKGVSLEIESGSLVSIVGPSGSGKTTLLNILGCMDVPTAGTYVCDGTEVSALKGSGVEKFRKENISFVFQQFALLDDYTVYENVELPLRVKNLTKKKGNGASVRCLKNLVLQSWKRNTARRFPADSSRDVPLQGQLPPGRISSLRMNRQARLTKQPGRKLWKS